jgi:hypothetical protein
VRLDHERLLQIAGATVNNAGPNDRMLLQLAGKGFEEGVALSRVDRRGGRLNGVVLVVGQGQRHRRGSGHGVAHDAATRAATARGGLRPNHPIWTDAAIIARWPCVLVGMESRQHNRAPAVMVSKRKTPKGGRHWRKRHSTRSTSSSSSACSFSAPASSYGTSCTIGQRRCLRSPIDGS